MSYTKNAAAFGKLVGICAGYEGKYNPARQNLSINAIRKMATDAEAANFSVIVARQNWIAATGNRKMAFLHLRQVIKRLRGEVGILATDSGTKNLLKVALSKASALGKAVNSDPPPTSETTKSPRTTGQDYATRLAALEVVVNALSNAIDYQPSSAELSVTALKAKIAELKAATEAVNTGYAELTEARNFRRQFFYKPMTGLVAVFTAVKNAIKAIFGNPSDELKAVQSIRIE